MSIETVQASSVSKPQLPPPPRAAELLFANATADSKLYWDRSHYSSPEAQMEALAKSKTLYIGNLAFSTRSSHVYSLFQQVGRVKTVIMGLDRIHKTPCGFCFVEYAEREDALLAIANLSGTKLDGRVIRVELDAGFQAGRQYGRGVHGGQVRDERRGAVDPARKGGAGRGSSSGPSTLKWTPPDQVAAEQQAQQDETMYGGAGAKRPREDDAEEDMGKNARFRED